MHLEEKRGLSKARTAAEVEEQIANVEIFLNEIQKYLETK